MSAEAQINIDVNTQDAQKSLDKFQGAIDTLGGSVEVVFGSLALFGVENEWISNLEQGAVGAIALADGAKRMTEGIIKFTGATTLAEAAQKAFNVVAATNPYVLLATGIAAAVIALMAYSKANKEEATPSTEELNTEVEKLIANFDRYNAQADKRIDAQRRLLEAQQGELTLAQEIGFVNEKIALRREDLIALDEEYNQLISYGVNESEKERVAAILEQIGATTESIKTFELEIQILKAKANQRKKDNQDSKDSTDNSIELANKEAQAKIDAENRYLDEVAALEEELYKAGLETRDKERRDLEDQYYERLNVLDLNTLALLEAKKAEGKQLTQAETDELAELNRLKLLIEEQYLIDQQALEKKFADEDNKAKKEQNAAIIKAQQDLYDELYALSLSDQDRAELQAQQLFDERVAAANDDAALIKMAEQQLVDDLNKIRKDAGDKAAEENQKVIDIQLEAENALYNAKMQLAYASIEVLKEVAGENQKIQNVIFAAEKALAIGELVTNLAKEVAANNANPTWSALPDGGKVVKAIFNTAARVRTAAAIAAIAKSTIAQFKSGGGNITAGSTTPGFTLASNVNANANQQTTPPTVQSGGPVQAYVLAGDVTDGIEAQQKLNSRRTL